MKFPILAATLSLLLIGNRHCAAQAEARTSENNPQLKRWLEAQPAADKNQDGILTIEEARAWQQSRSAQRNTAAPARRPKPSHPDVPYGDHERHVLDFYQAESKHPTPLVIYIHGGGFVGGTKSGINAGMIQDCHAAGISCAAIHYRFVDGALDVSTCMLDGARAVQFLRSQAREWNLDPTKIACYGGSAGAGISMWIGFHDDLADPSSPDPVLRHSTRISAIATLGGQSTYDPRWIKREIGGRAWEHPSIFKMFKMKGPEDLNNPALFKLYAEVSAITHLTKDDPAIHMWYSEADGLLPDNARPGQGIHHPKFGHHLKREMDALGIESVYTHADQVGRNQHPQIFAFFKKHFEMK